MVFTVCSFPETDAEIKQKLRKITLYSVAVAVGPTGMYETLFLIATYIRVNYIAHLVS